MRSRPFRPWPIAPLIALSLGACLGGRPAVSPEFLAPPAIQPRHHELHVSLDPPARALTAEDRITLNGAPSSATTTAFYLDDRMTVDRVSLIAGSGPKEIPFHRGGPRLPRAPFARERYAAFAEMSRYEIDLPARGGADPPLQLAVRYTGRWPESPAHDEAVNEHGTQLTGDDGWYPLWPDALFTFDLTVEHPADWEAVSAGRQTSRTESSGRLATAWSTAQPGESIDLFAGPYQVTVRQNESVELSTYLFADEASLAPVYLDAAADYLARYSRLLGPYPFPKLAVVETPEPIGASTPSLVLLGRSLIRRHYIQPYALGHEIVHSWFGNSVMADDSEGNWTEALTTYVANYDTAAERQGEAAAREQRVLMLRQYAALVPPGRDYPLMRFLYNSSQTDAAIGYQKGAFVFHLLRRMLGGEDFYGALRDLTERYRGKRANWNDLRLLFEARLGQPLDWFFRQWVVRAGAPHLTIDTVTMTPLPPDPTDPGLPPGQTVAVTLRQSPPVFRIPVVVQIETSNRLLEKSIWMDQERVELDTATAAPPLRIAVDPDVQLFRRLERDELPPMLNLTLTEPSLTILPPERADAELTRAYQVIADGARRRHDAEAGHPVAGGHVHAAPVAARLILGGPDVNQAAAELVRQPVSGSESRLPPGIRIEPKRFTIGGRTYDGAGHALLLSFRDPAGRNGPVTFFYGLSPNAVTPLGPLLFYHGWDSYVVFDNGHAVATGELPAQRTPLVWTPPHHPPPPSTTPPAAESPGHAVP
ncbi:MAG TPA: M1 family aminopeptidase [Nitrospiria bacterium]|nr:M1 family aminopeptidase [Nitrospiria bacterium]